MMDTWLLCVAVNSSMQMPLASDLHPAMEVTAAENRKAKPQMHSKPVACLSCSPWETVGKDKEGTKRLRLW